MSTLSITRDGEGVDPVRLHEAALEDCRRGGAASIVNDKPLYLWRKGKTTGLWRVARDVTPETASAWLRVFQADEPDVEFRVSKHKPRDRT